MTQTRVVRHIRAARESVYRALVDADAVAAWRVPDGMTGATDTYHGRFVELVLNERVVEELEFETTDPTFAGLMWITTTLVDAGGGTDVVVLHDGIPPGVPAADNEIGTEMALGKLAALVES